MSIITIFLTARRTIQVERPRQLLGRVRVRLAQVLLQGAPAHPRSLPRGVSGYKHQVRVRVGQGGPGRAWAVDPRFVADAENSMPRERFPHEVQAACWRQLPAAERVSAHDWVAVDVEAEVCGGEGTGEVVFGISRVVGGWGALGPDVACDEDDCELWVQVVRVPVASSLPAGVPLSHAIHEPLARRDTHVHVCQGGRHAEAGACPGVPVGVDGGGVGAGAESDDVAKDVASDVAFLSGTLRPPALGGREGVSALFANARQGFVSVCVCACVCVCVCSIEGSPSRSIVDMRGLRCMMDGAGGEWRGASAHVGAITTVTPLHGPCARTQVAVDRHATPSRRTATEGNAPGAGLV